MTYMGTFQLKFEIKLWSYLKLALSNLCNWKVSSQTKNLESKSSEGIFRLESEKETVVIFEISTCEFFKMYSLAVNKKTLKLGTPNVNFGYF